MSYIPHVHHRTESDVNTLALVFLAHEETTQANESTIPSEFTDVRCLSKDSKIKTHVAAAVMPVGNAVTKSVSRTPRGESYTRRDKFPIGSL